MKLGVAISVYNKVDELATNVGIIREFWPFDNDAFISVCCNDPASIDAVRALDVNSVTAGADIPSTPKPNLRRRQFDCIKKSIQACDADVIVHWHADAFATRVGPILEIVNLMGDEKVFAFRGRGLDYYNPKTIFGDVDDHFLFVHRRGIGVFDVDPMEHLAFCNVESFLSLLIKPHRELAFHYSDMKENLVGDVGPDEFYDDRVQHRAMNPFNVDPSRGFVHAQTRELIREKLLLQRVPQELIRV